MGQQLYLYDKLREKYIDNLEQIKDIFFDRIRPVFANAEKKAEEFENQLWDNLMIRPCGEEDYIDLFDLAEAAQEEGYSKHEILLLI